jgi:hypothetical protein
VFAEPKVRISPEASKKGKSKIPDFERGYRELKKRGVSRDLAWNTAKPAHGLWRLSRSPGLAFALPAKYFARLGLPKLFVKPT